MAKRKKGIVLVLGLAFLALFTIVSILSISTIVSSFKLTKRLSHSLRAFYLAESGIQKALYELRTDDDHWYNWSGEGPLPIVWNGSSKGEYKVTVATLADNKKQVVSTGYFPQKSGSLATRAIEVIIKPPTPSWFYDNAITAGKNVDLNGNYIVGGNTMYSESIEPADYQPSQKFDEGFPSLNFDQLRLIAASQPNSMTISGNNIYTQADFDAYNGKPPFPSSFWYNEGESKPNVIYVETNLILRGSVGTICGFFVVVGNVVTDPSGSADTTINGNGTIDGCVYTLGNFRINGGGNGLGVTGCVWGRDEVRLNGNAKVSIDPVVRERYTDAIEGLGIGFVAQILSWKEKY